MLSPAQMHFRMLSPEAQHAALQRLAWRGCDLKAISMETGLPEAAVRQLLDLQSTGAPSAWQRGPKSSRTLS